MGPHTHQIAQTVQPLIIATPVQTVVNGDDATAYAVLEDKDGKMEVDVAGRLADAKVNDKSNADIYVYAKGDADQDTAQAQSHNFNFYA